ncbi:MAG TPA: multiheme c-type cytochrome [Planctomycetota bacterium]|nr:multiheme c-type cytochrome [Planctomycetota bacterium]
MKRLAWLLVPAAALAIAACSALPFFAQPVADNSRCHVCHINYSEDKLAVNHAKRNVGCERCHGPSDDHCGSESHELAPDLIYAKAAINPACIQCHPRRTLARQVSHCLVLDPDAPLKRYCTDCHGTHRLANRQVRWDKKTRELLPPS